MIYVPKQPCFTENMNTDYKNDCSGTMEAQTLHPESFPIPNQSQCVTQELHLNDLNSGANGEVNMGDEVSNPWASREGREASKYPSQEFFDSDQEETAKKKKRQHSKKEKRSMEAVEQRRVKAVKSHSSKSKFNQQCTDCLMVLTSRQNMLSHQLQCKGVDDKDASQKCSVGKCTFRTHRRDLLEEHMYKHIADGFTPSGKRRNGTLGLPRRVRYEKEEYHCSKCTYTCTVEKAFVKHVLNHDLGTNNCVVKISCIICGKDRTTNADMDKHMTKHQEGDFYRCDLCDFKTVQLKKVIQHRRMHTGERPHLCPHCPYRSARRDNLRSHARRLHNKQNVYSDTFLPTTVPTAPDATE